MKRNIRPVLLGALALAMTACNGSEQKFLDQVDLKVTAHENDSYIQLTSTFELGNVSISSVNFTVLDPHRQPVGTVSFEQLPSTQGLIKLEVNATKLFNADPDLGMSLPNGRPIPLALNLQRGDSLAVPFNENSRVYLGGRLQTTLFAGVALGIKGLDQVMNQLSNPANVFISFSPSNQLLGVGGIYASPVANQNGIAVFAKYSKTGGLLSDETDTDVDNEFEQMNSASQNALLNLLHGAPQKLEIQ